MEEYQVKLPPREFTESLNSQGPIGPMHAETANCILAVGPESDGSELHWTPDWAGVTMRNLKVGTSMLMLSMSQSEGAVYLKVENSGRPVRVAFAPEIPLGSSNLRALINGRPLAASIRTVGQEAEAEATFNTGRNAAVELRFEPGVRPLGSRERLVAAPEASDLRMSDSKLQEHTYTAQLEGRPDTCSSFSLFAPWRLTHVQGGEVEGHDGQEWKFIASPRPDLRSDASPARSVS